MLVFSLKSWRIRFIKKISRWY